MAQESYSLLGEKITCKLRKDFIEDFQMFLLVVQLGESKGM